MMMTKRPYVKHKQLIISVDVMDWSSGHVSFCPQLLALLVVVDWLGKRDDFKTYVTYLRQIYCNLYCIYE